MRVGTLASFLVGKMDAIIEIATDRRAIWIGFLFVLSAGLAREYDHESLLHEPWHVLIPLAASLVTSAALFLVLYAIPTRPDARRPNIFKAYRSFLSLYWMTAPLAWLYAIPYERMLNAGDAAAANLWTLAIVAGWRVLLMTRVISVLLNIGVTATFMIVMLFADGLVLLTLSFAKLPMINFMGGVSLSQSEQVIANVAFMTTVLGFLLLPVFLIGAFAAFCNVRSEWRSVTRAHTDGAPSAKGRLMWLAIAAVLAGLILLPFTQSEQGRRYRVERLLTHGEIEDGLRLMSQFDVSDFPPHWDPPPRRAYRERKPDIVAVAKVISIKPTADWIRDTYAEKLDSFLRAELFLFGSRAPWPDIARDGSHLEIEDLRDRAEGLKLLLLIGSHLQNEDREAIQSLLDRADAPDQ